jgi:hypothetical protein
MSELFHISFADFDRYHFDAIRGPELAMIEEHLVWCIHCQGREDQNSRSIQEIGRAEMDHVTTDDLELYQLGHVTGAPTITEIEQHVLQCQECADRMLAIERFIKLVRVGVIRRDSLPSFPVGDSTEERLNDSGFEGATE